ncbi:monovalent cation/H(+) antiporter subunit G [Paenibacillus sanguinis]|uniref:monovalent cation/H(+) antiporter subunit G n=1 Tax=Paenibacillus sanguinis TaxID=225906 RepID=UPI00037F1F75|nr:monovalent cation/H(+) antiporter subunit G [Paenibacillus sanguinis]
MIEIISQIGEILLGLVIVAGSVIGLLSVFGLIRLPDLYLRAHAATKSATLGVLLILSGVFFYFTLYLEHTSLKLLLGIAFVFLTSPVAGHLSGRAAYRSGVPLWENTIRDDLNNKLEQKTKEDS